MTMHSHKTIRAIENTASDFPTQADWRAAQRNFVSFHDEDGRDHWLVVPFTFCPNVAEILDESNWNVLQEMLAEADPTGETYEIQRFSHWATPYDRIVVEPNSEAHGAMAEAVCSMADYPVLDESDFSEREHEASYENVHDAIAGQTFERNGAELESEDISALAGELHHWYGGNGNWGFLENPGQCSVRDDERTEGLNGLGWYLGDDDVWHHDGDNIPAGTVVRITAHKAPPHCGLEYPDTIATLCEECRPGGWDAVEVTMPDGTSKAVYSFSVSRIE